MNENSTIIFYTTKEFVELLKEYEGKCTSGFNVVKEDGVYTLTFDGSY